MTSVSIKTFTQSITMFPNPPYTAVAKKKKSKLNLLETSGDNQVISFAGKHSLQNTRLSI